METSDILSYISMAIAVGSMIFHIVNHKRIRSNCCGAVLEASIDVENTTPLLRQLNVSKPPGLEETAVGCVSP